MFRPKNSAVNLNVEKVLVPCRNGLTFGPSSQIVFDIPRNIGFANLKNARLLTSVRIDATPNSVEPAYIPDRIAGANIFIERCTIRSNGVLLEEMSNYNLYAKLYNSASWDTGIENKRTRLEGCMKSNRIQDSPYHIGNAPLADAAAGVAANNLRSVERQVELPILGGIFQKDIAWPLGEIPLEIEIILARAEEVLGLPDSAGGGTRINVVGDQVGGIVCANTAGAAGTNIQISAAQTAVYGPIGAGNELSTDANQNVVSCFPLKIGQLIRLTATAATAARLTALATNGTMTITAITCNAGAFNITTSGAIDIGGGAGGVAAGVRLSTIDANGVALSGNAQTYRWSQPRLIIPKVVPPPQWAAAMMQAVVKGQYSVDVTSYINYRNAIVGTTTSSTSIIPADLSRVKAILSVPVDEVGKERVDTRNGTMGGYMGAQSYQFQINNNLAPSRLVQLGREAFNNPADLVSGAWGQTKAIPYEYGLGSNTGGVHAYELEKAIHAANIPLRNLTFITKPAALNGCWALGRVLGPYGTSANLMGISSILYLNYDGSNANLKLLHNYVAHIRTFAVQPGGVQVIY